MRRLRPSRILRRGPRLFATILMGLFLLAACRSIPVSQRDEVRAALDQSAKEDFERLLTEEPQLSEEYEHAVGYFAGEARGVMAAVVGLHRGLGVLVDRETGERTYLDIEGIEFGAGLGLRSYGLIGVIEERELFDQCASGLSVSAVGIDAAAGEAGGSEFGTALEGAQFWLLPDRGGAISATVQVMTLSVNEDLTDTGVSEISIPNTGYDRAGKQRDDAPRKWARVLPFFAQDIIDRGFDLPLPFGIGLTYASVKQDNDIENLQVGINGREKVPFEFVEVKPVRSVVDSWSVKLDAWVLPFLNVYGLYGRVKGTAELDIMLDGNQMLEHLEIDCGGVLPNPLCQRLQDRKIRLPRIETDISGATYGLGALVAAGWNGWFLALPVTYTYADLEGKDTEGHTFTCMPRVGRVVPLGDLGNLSLFAGGTYLHSALTVSGQVRAEGLVLDYSVEQENRDKWNLAFGANWDITKRWALTAEYDGFIGSREAFFLSLAFSY